MKLRPIAAALTLIALTFSFAEGVWASTCMPEMAMDGMSAESGFDGHAVGMNGYPGAADDPSEPEQEPPCPFAPVSIAGACIVAASLPATSPIEISPSFEGALLTDDREHARDLLLTTALFHPPRA